jgi:3alpha(or 20beta)-hydroxysteroid dehydrogenase
VSRIKSKFGALHILMNVVGTNDLTVIGDTDPVEWNRIFEVNARVSTIQSAIDAAARMFSE